MAIRVQNLPKKNFEGSSAHMLSHYSVSCLPWRNPSEQQLVPQNISLKVETPSQLYHNAKHLGLQLTEQELSLSQAIGQSQLEVGAIGVNNSQCNSSESGHEDENCGKHIEGQMKPVFLINNPNTVFSSSLPNYNLSIACTRYPCADAYFGGLFTTNGQPAIMAGSAPARIPLPLDLSEDGPIYVNAKQYHGILRRRQYRAKLEAQNKLVKSRKPYLHESRHVHAMNRVRGSGGRFLSKRKLQQPDLTSATGSLCISDNSCMDQKSSRTEFESPHSNAAEYAFSSTSCSDVTSVSYSDGNFYRLHHPMQNNGVRTQHCASVVQ